jgi:hypothetical protein
VATVTSIPAQCDNCGHTWDHALEISIQTNNGDTLSFAPGSVRGICPECGALGVNVRMLSTTATGQGIRGLLAVLRSAEPEDLERLTKIALAAKESGAGNAEVAEQIRTSIPRLRPVADWLLSPQGAALAAWVAVLIAVLVWVTTRTPSSPAPDSHPAPKAPTSQTVIVNCPDGQERMTRDLLEQIAREVRGIEGFGIKDGASEAKPEH